MVRAGPMIVVKARDDVPKLDPFNFGLGAMASMASAQDRV